MKKIIIMLSLLLIMPVTVNARNHSRHLLEDEKNTIDVFKQISPSVVFIYKMRRIQNGHKTQYIPSGSAGSGFFWGNDGYLVTNFHVVRQSRTIAISFQPGKAHKAIIVGVEPRKDIAVLKLLSKPGLAYAKNLKPIPIANSTDIDIGEKTIAIGNPYGLDRTLTTGIVSATGRRVPGYGGVTIYDMIQTDASINPGNSGGPLLNSEGELIGMNTMIFSRSGSSSGIGFAIPANTISRIVNQLIQHGRVIQKGLGIHQLDIRLAAQVAANGLIIQDVAPNSPADKAGLRGTRRDRHGRIVLGDIIIGINGKPVRNYDDYYNLLEKTNLGETVRVEFMRKNKRHRVNMQTVDVSRI